MLCVTWYALFMQERVKTSFIPKASLSVEGARRPSSSPLALVNIAASAILIIAVLASVGVFLFQQYTAQSLESKKESLERSRAAFEPATIKELSRLDTRITTGSTLLTTHVALSKLFSDLESRTLSTVRFKNFSYAVIAPGQVQLSMTGEAESFNAVALQSDAFSKSGILTEPIFSDVNIDKSGLIIFDFTSVVDTTRVLYEPGQVHATPAPPESGTP